LASRFGSLLLHLVAVSFWPPSNEQCLFVLYCTNFNDTRTATSESGSPMVLRLFGSFPGVGLRTAEE
jgi:hypothetical protein